MTKAELVEKVSHKINLTRKQTEVIVSSFFECITKAMSEGKKVELRGFGGFRTKKRKPRKGRNPKTGAKVTVPEKNVPFFKAGKELRSLVNK